jgi:hypothetical protein
MCQGFSADKMWRSAETRLFEALNRRRRGQLGCGWRGPRRRRSPSDWLRTCRRRRRILAHATGRGFAGSLPGNSPRTGSSEPPGMRDRRSRGISNHGACNRAHRTEHYCARPGAHGGVAATALGQRGRRKRQGYDRRKDKSLHSGFPPNRLSKHVTPELRPYQGKIRIWGVWHACRLAKPHACLCQDRSPPLRSRGALVHCSSLEAIACLLFPSC